MRLSAILSSTLVVAAVSAAAGNAASAAEVTREVATGGTAEEVWAVVGPVCAIADWYPGIDSCTEETVDGAPHRRLTASDGAVFLEKMLGHDDASMSYSYAIIESPLPISDYSADFTVKDDGGHAVVVWHSRFEPSGVSEEEATGVVTSIYETGLDAIKARFPD